MASDIMAAFARRTGGSTNTPPCKWIKTPLHSSVSFVAIHHPVGPSKRDTVIVRGGRITASKPRIITWNNASRSP